MRLEILRYILALKLKIPKLGGLFAAMGQPVDLAQGICRFKTRKVENQPF